MKFLCRSFPVFSIFLCLILTATSNGCGGSSGTTPPPLTSTPNPVGPTAASSMYVGEELPSGGLQFQALQFSTQATGTVAPIAIIALPGNFYPSGFATDAAGYLYVVGDPFNTPPSEILVYAPGAIGSAKPIRTISGSNTGINFSICLAVDSTGNLYIGDSTNNSISVFAPGATGNVAPLRVISGPATLLNNPYRIAIDPTGNLYVSDGQDYDYTTSQFIPGRILIFPPAATGNAAPTLLTGNSTNLGWVFGLATDSAGNLFVASQTDSHTGGIRGILEFAHGATGNTAPINTISGKLTGTAQLQGIAVDGVGNIYVDGISNFVFDISIFPPTATGNVAPATVVNSTSWDDGSLINIAIH